MNKITFIIPTIGRKTLINSLQSLISQDNPNWCAIVIFDGVSKNITSNIIIDDERITYLYIDKKIGVSNHAGNVRNFGIKHSKTEWCGFLDDDDCLTPNYVSLFYNTIENYKEVEVIQWRMKVKGQYVPGATGEIKVCNIGISQSIKTSILLEYPFEPSWCEDYNLLNRLKNANKKIIISDNITYLVRNEKISNFPKFTKRFYNFQPLT